MNRRRFKDRLASGKTVLLPGVANPLSARVAADLGFEALYVTGAGVANFELGLPDIGILNLSDMAQAVERIAGTTDLPLVVDADTGYGNSVSCYHAVRRLEAAGAAAIQIEDQVFPKRCGHFEGKEVAPAEEMTGKIKAATDARRDENTLIVARTDAKATEGYEAAIERAARYAEAGADILFVEALTSEQELRDAPTRNPLPHLVNVVHGGKTPPFPASEFEAMGYSLVLYANAALQAAVAGMQHVLGALHADGSLEKVGDRLAGFAERQRVVRTHEWDALRKVYEDGGTV
ncbi:carboxyvinyl-carboxyphosphonate phosphorylmutase [Novosphingobium sp. PC22D]|uniref:isocitrate lyase/PEP mutase family protein n=1 Tax=Novosphingobium sp. PC22D TaxID=1962403 RepID=UPI000BF0EBFE|nr:isocitrate lyase/phosphoenolpyruvate mutase family protein [Novosphingobium sp. PC22D]PEQ11387.1 carboxyvinyl-carboxyphosphonate phosphorylmutase [Novosphingobium sp. PC22D]